MLRRIPGMYQKYVINVRVFYLIKIVYGPFISSQNHMSQMSADKKGPLPLLHFFSNNRNFILRLRMINSLLGIKETCP